MQLLLSKADNMKKSYVKTVEQSLVPHVNWEAVEWHRCMSLTKQEQMKSRITAAELGYYITETAPEEPEPRRTPAKGRRRKGGQAPPPQKAPPIITLAQDAVWHSVLGADDARRGMGCGVSDSFWFVQLYRCANCRTVLFRPLMCGDCMAVAYCSLVCQRQHWKVHEPYCRARKKKFKELGKGFIDTVPNTFVK